MALPSYFCRHGFSAVYQGLEVHSCICQMGYTKFTSCQPYGCEASTMHSHFKPYASIIGNGNWSISQLCIVQCPWGLYFSSWDFLSSHVMSRICRMFCRDAIPALSVDVKGASENCKFIHSWEDNPKHCVPPVGGCRYVEKLILMSPTGRSVISTVGLFLGISGISGRVL